jgi:ring-1,2-phenylacetyl-CoA epoxidase subunit PaaC
VSAAIDAGVSESLCCYLLRLGDTSLILGQRLSEWVGHAPELEEDLGFANIALDLIGQARLLLSYAGELEGRGRGEDQLAFLRDGAEFCNFTLAEQPNGDFGQTIARQFLVDAFQFVCYGALAGSRDERLAAIAAKSLKETRYHLRFSAGWLVRLGDGTEESHDRVQRAVDVLWPFTAELFTADEIDRAMVDHGIAPPLESLAVDWSRSVEEVFGDARLVRPNDVPYRWHGKRGCHGEHLGYLLAEMQFLQRAYPGTSW